MRKMKEEIDMRKVLQQHVRPRNVAAQSLADPRFRKRVVQSKVLYSRKGRSSSMRKLEDSI